MTVTSSSGNRSDGTSVLDEADRAACTPQLVTGGGGQAMVSHEHDGLVARFADGSTRLFDSEEELAALLADDRLASIITAVARIDRPAQLKLLALEPPR